ncbi:uncharacterized protein LOC133545246 isoform X1 [Nerophis ophidion]|uniref:uncharacterized protein LOC133545246 isoform X1 n=1 Tax=Nerophis ophidion TaxID=159077 RepID=UPI002ADF57B8|nr:uncharacterized protein LOC133545246 isoform X1 [Nerophis ophidion]XP_061746619.1 uncharacterized protein LOC133545246 isoform X1 [Nerophis ophidion]
MVCLVPEEFLERWELTDGLETQVLKTLQGLSFCPCEIGRNREGATREERWVLVRRDQRVDLRRQKTRSNLTWWCHSELRLVDGTKLRPLSRRERCDEVSMNFLDRFTMFLFVFVVVLFVLVWPPRQVGFLGTPSLNAEANASAYSWQWYRSNVYCPYRLRTGRW